MQLCKYIHTSWQSQEKFTDKKFTQIWHVPASGARGWWESQAVSGTWHYAKLCCATSGLVTGPSGDETSSWLAGAFRTKFSLSFIVFKSQAMRVEFLLKSDSWYPKDSWSSCQVTKNPCDWDWRLRLDDNRSCSGFIQLWPQMCVYTCRRV